MATYYVHPTSGSNSNSGAEGAPWQTIAYATQTATTGDTITLRGGANSSSRVVYTQRVAITAGAGCDNGTSGSPITITNYPGEFIELRPTSGVSSTHLFSVTRNWWKWSFQAASGGVYYAIVDLQDQGSSGMAFLFDGANDCTVENLQISNGAYYTMFEMRASARIVLQDSTLFDNNAGAFTDASGVSFRPYNGDVDDCVVRRCTIYDVRGDCVVMLARNTGTYRVNRPTVESCTLYTTLGGSSENAVDMKNCFGGTVSSNTAYGFRYCDGSTGGSGSGSRGGECFLLQENGGTVSVFNNTIYDISGPAMDFSGLNAGGTATCYFYKNRIYDLSAVDSPSLPSVFYVYDTGAGTAYFYNNTVYGRHGSTGHLIYHGALSNAVLRNNGFVNTGDITEDAGYTRTYSHNGWYNAAETISGTGDVTTDPAFTNAAADDYTIWASSPWVNAGTVIAPYTDGYSGAAPDIGYYEYVSTQQGGAALAAAGGMRAGAALSPQYAQASMGAAGGFSVSGSYAAFTWDIQAKFSGTAGAWTSIRADVVSSRGVQWSYGINGGGPLDRIASTGQLTFSLDNSTGNAAGSVGYYSPGHASCRSGFNVGIPVQVVLSYGGTDYYKFVGTLEDAQPTMGLRGERVTVCTVVDWIDEAAKQKTANIATQTGKRADEIVAAIVANMTRQPAATSYATAQMEFPYALDTAEDEATSAMTELAKAVYSDMGYLYVMGGAAPGGILRYEDRRIRQAATTTTATLTDTMVEMGAKRSRGEIYNRVKVNIYPRRVDAGTDTVLYEYDSSQLLALGPSETVTIIGQYRDPDQRAARVGGVEIQTPISGTDYMFGTGPGDNSLAAYLTVDVTSGGNSAIIELTNTGTVSGFVTMLQLRGRGLYDYGSITIQAVDSTSRTAYGEYVLTLDLPHEGRQHVASTFANVFLADYKDPRTYPESVSFWAQASATLMLYALAREPGDLVSISETVTGISTTFFINGVSYHLVDGQNLRATWILAPDLDTETVFQIGTSTISGTDVLGW